MSKRLATLLEEARSGTFSSDHARFAWLQAEGGTIVANYVHPENTFREMMARYADEASAGAATSRSEGWAVAATALAAAHPDPDDVLYGLYIATETWALGLTYGLADMARFVARAVAIPYAGEPTGDPAQDAYEAYEILLNRVNDLDAMLRAELDDEIVSWDWSKDPDTLANAMDLLYRYTNDYAERVETEEAREVDVEELDDLVRESGYMLWACYHAAQADVPFEELAEFVRIYPDDWTDVFRAVLEERALAPGVLAALCDTHASAAQVLANGAEAVALYRADPTPDLPLVDYLDLALTATNAPEA